MPDRCRPIAIDPTACLPPFVADKTPASGRLGGQKGVSFRRHQAGNKRAKLLSPWPDQYAAMMAMGPDHQTDEEKTI